MVSGPLFVFLILLVSWMMNHKVNVRIYSYGHLLVITGYFNGIIHVINGVFLVLITGIWGHKDIDILSMLLI